MMRLFSTATSLPQRAAHAGFWALALQIADQALLLIRTVVLARLLSPDDFGLFGLALISMTAAAMFVHTGFEPALIQREGSIKPYLDTVWTVNVIRGFFLALVLFVSAPLIAAFFGDPRVVPFLRFVGLSMVCQGFTNSAVVYFQKELAFHREFIFLLCGSIADFLVAITAAVVLRSAWALLFGFLAGVLVRLVASFLFLPHRPRFSLEKKKLADLFRFGSWMWLTGIMFFIGMNGSGVVVGKVTGVAALGLFLMARRIPQLTLGGLSAAVEKVAFPTYAHMQSDAQRIKRGYAKIAGFAVALCMPLAFGIMAVGSDFIHIFLGEQWVPMVPALVIATAGGLITVVASTGRPVFMGRGAPKVAFQMQLARSAMIIVFSYPLTARWGITGAALAVALSAVAMSVVWWIRISEHLDLSAGDWGRMFGPPAISSAAMMAAIGLFRWLTRSLIPETQFLEFSWLAAMVLLGVAVYAFCMHWCQSKFPGYVGLGAVFQTLWRRDHR